MNEWEWHLLEDPAPVECVTAGDAEIRTGDRVRLKPRHGGDIMDGVLAGKIAIIEKIDQDYEGKIQMAVVVEDDPGRDLGMLRQPGHRFFFRIDEIEPV